MRVIAYNAQGNGYDSRKTTFLNPQMGEGISFVSRETITTLRQKEELKF